MFKKLSKREVTSNQTWAKEEYFRQQNDVTRIYSVSKEWHPVVRIHFCKYITDEALGEMP
jgi:hypothetical protein